MRFYAGDALLDGTDESHFYISQRDVALIKSNLYPPDGSVVDISHVFRLRSRERPLVSGIDGPIVIEIYFVDIEWIAHA